MLCIDDIQPYGLMIYLANPKIKKTYRFAQKILDIF